MSRDDELTPAERNALETLSREKEPSPFLEERLVRELRNRGILRPARTIELTGWRVASAAAACLLLVIAGFGLGRVSRATGDVGHVIQVAGADELAVAYTLQRAGTAYVLALEDLTVEPGVKAGPAVRQGREIALATLFTAAGEMAKVVPKDRLAEQILVALEVPGREVPRPEGRTDGTREVWF